MLTNDGVCRPRRTGFFLAEKIPHRYMDGSASIPLGIWTLRLLAKRRGGCAASTSPLTSWAGWLREVRFWTRDHVVLPAWGGLAGQAFFLGKNYIDASALNSPLLEPFDCLGNGEAAAPPARHAIGRLRQGCFQKRDSEVLPAMLASPARLLGSGN
ncbi:hypothetical protein BDZ89DRAFT_445145 [Hymenopellis radicata]|nr:hypothetical protein BDZ89DRAFT_445145 [Hymenopellis radicata]